MLATSPWRVALPVLTGRTVTLREPEALDLGALVELLSLADATRFGMDESTPIELGVQRLIERSIQDRAAGLSFTYSITLTSSRRLVGLVQVRQLDPTFEAAEWECTLSPVVRGSGVFIESARLAGSLAFGTVGAHRLEARVALQNGRANGALRKLGAVQEGVLRRATRWRNKYIDQVLWSVLKDDWGDHWVSTSPRVH